MGTDEHGFLVAGSRSELWSKPCCQCACGDRAEGWKALLAVLNETHAMIIDMSAIKLLTALNRAGQARAVFIAFSLSLAGCSTPRPGPGARATPPAGTDTSGAQELAVTTKPPEPQARPAPPGPQPTQRVSSTKTPPATASKGAEKLLVLSRPLPVLARERTTPPSEPAAPKAPIAAKASTVTGAPVEPLVLRGPPPQTQRQRPGVTALVWLGAVIGAAALAILAGRCLTRRVKPADLAAFREDELRMPRELGFEEPVNVAREPATAGKR